MKAYYQPYILQFKREAGTSRGILKTKKTYILTIENEEDRGVGECALFEGLSADDIPNYEEVLEWTCDNITLDFRELYEKLRPYPSIQIGVEQALLNLYQKEDLYFDTAFYKGEEGIPINGLIWMGSMDFMRQQFDEKIAQGYRCIKFKIGVNWVKEKEYLQQIRQQYSAEELEIRVDANGAFSNKEVKSVLEELLRLHIHSIEQPIKAGNREKMAQLCKTTPVPIALDEELIGCFYKAEKKLLLEQIMPQYIILKPSLIGGFRGSEEWIELAQKLDIAWWITSALESNIGLNAIAQFTASLPIKMPQGLGTGGLFTNNFKSKLFIENCKLRHEK